MRLRDVPEGAAFRYIIGDKVAETLPVFVRLAGDRILNTVSGAIFALMNDDVELCGPLEERGPVWRNIHAHAQ